MTVRAVILDWDGTTFNSWPQALRIIEEIFLEFNGIYTKKQEAELRRLWGYSAADAFKNVLPDCDYDKVYAAWKEKLVNSGQSEKIELIHGAKETISWLANQDNITCTLATNRKAKHLASNLPDSIDLTLAFAIVQTLYDPKRADEIFITHPCHIASRYPKPNPEAFQPIVNVLNTYLCIINNTGINYEEVLVVDDSLVGLEVANANNMQFVAVLTGAINTETRWLSWAKQRGLVITPEQIIPSIKHLPEWIEKYGQ